MINEHMACSPPGRPSQLKPALGILIDARELASYSSTMDNQKNIQSVARALAILDQVAQQENGAALGQISSALGLNKSTVHGIAATLERFGYLTRHEEGGRYALGLKAWELGQAYVGNLNLEQVARGYMAKLVAKHEDASHLGVLAGTEALFIQKIDCSRTVGLRIRVGTRTPLYCTGVGKSLLAYQSQQDRDRILSQITLEPFTGKTILDFPTLEKELLLVRERGYSCDQGEIESDLRSVGSPIFDHTERCVAAVSLAGSSSRFTAKRLPEIIEDVKNTADQISRQLGYIPRS